MTLEIEMRYRPCFMHEWSEPLFASAEPYRSAPNRCLRCGKIGTEQDRRDRMARILMMLA